MNNRVFSENMAPLKSYKFKKIGDDIKGEVFASLCKVLKIFLIKK